MQASHNGPIGGQYEIDTTSKIQKFETPNLIYYGIDHIELSLHYRTI